MVATQWADSNLPTTHDLNAKHPATPPFVACWRPIYITYTLKLSLMIRNAFYFIACAFALVIIGCTGEKQVADGAIKLDNFTHSSCKDRVATVPMDYVGKPIPTDGEYIKYEADNDGNLIIKHVNAVFNCRSESLRASLTEADGEITLNETEVDGQADCFCPYDLNFKIGKLTNRKYTLTVLQNSKAHKKFSFEYRKGLRGKAVIRIGTPIEKDL